MEPSNDVQQPKKLHTSDNVKPKESTKKTPYIPAMHQEQKDSVSFSGGNKPASAKKASNFLSKISSKLMQGLEGQTPGSIINKMTELNKNLEDSIKTLKQSNTSKDYDGAKKNIDNFIQVYFESFVINSEVAAQTALEGGLKNVLKDDKDLSIELLASLYNKIEINSDEKEYNAAYTLINKIAQLPDNEIDKDVKKSASFKANSIDLSLKVKNENYNDIIQSAIKLCKIDDGNNKTKIQKVIKIIKKLIKNEEKGIKLVNTITQYIKSNPNSTDATICKSILQKISTLDEMDENEVNGTVKNEAINKLNELETQNEVKVPNKLASLDTALNVEPFDKDNVISTTLDIVKKDPEMVNDVVGKISSFLTLKNDSKMVTQLFSGLFSNITNNPTSDEGLKTLELILKAFINLPEENTNSKIEAQSNVFLKRLNLFNLINNKNSSIEDILNAGIDYIKYKHPQVSVAKPLKELIPILKDDEKGLRFIKALYDKVCDKGTMQDDLKAALLLFDNINNYVCTQISENVYNISIDAYSAYCNGNYEFTFPNLQEKELEKELKKGKECNMSNVVNNALSLASSSNDNYNIILNKFIAFIQNNDKKDPNLNNKLLSNLYKKSTCYPPTNESTTALSLLKSLENQQNGVISESPKKQIKKFIALSNLYNVVNNPDKKMEEIVNNMLESKVFFKEQGYGNSTSLVLQQATNILTDVNKGHELLKILFEKTKNPQQQDDVIEFLHEIQYFESPEINENVAKTANNVWFAIINNQEKYEVSMPQDVNVPQNPITNPNKANGNTIQSGISIFSTPQTEEYKKMVEAKIAKFEPKKGKNGEHLKQTLYINGKAMEFMCYKDPKMKYAGSHYGYFVYNPDTHDLCWFKAGSEQSKAEAIASQLYSLAGVPSAEMQLCSNDNGEACILSRYLFLDKVPQTPEEKKKLNQGFGMDVLLANWDAVISDNAQMSGEQAYRVDFGGTFNYRAQGGTLSNKFISIPDEITSMFDEQYDSYKMFDTMTREDLINSLESVCKINDYDMATMLLKSDLKIYKNTLLKRKEYLKEMLDIIKDRPKEDNVSMFDYLTNIKHEVIKNHITNASKASEITDLQMALDKITDFSMKQKLQDALNTKKTEIEASQQHTPKSITEDELQNLLTNSIYTKNSSGNYVIDVNKSEYKDYIQAIEQHCGKKYSKIVKDNYLSSSINNDMLKDMLQMLNYDNGKFIDIFTKDIKSFVIFYNDVKKSIDDLTEIEPEKWEALVNSFINPANQDEIQSVIYYKYDSCDINGALTMQKTQGTLPRGNIKKTIDNLTSYIQTQEVPQDMVVYRGEGYSVLNSTGNVTVQFSDGSSTTKPLGDLLQDAVSYPEEKRLHLVDQLLNMNLVATQERFISTSAKEKACFHHENVEWELTVPAGSHALYVELANLTSYDNHQYEKEFILQRDSQITITAIIYNDEKKKWICKGIVNTP